MIIPNILALDVDGVLCDGMQEYCEASRRSYMSVWPDETVPGEDLFRVFRTLRALIVEYTAAYGRPPRLWFVEDRLDTLQHITTHADLADVALFLEAWGYNTPEMRASVRSGGRIRLLELDQFRGGLTTWG